MYLPTYLGTNHFWKKFKSLYAEIKHYVWLFQVTWLFLTNQSALSHCSIATLREHSLTSLKEVSLYGWPLFDWLGFSWFAYVELDRDLQVWSNPNQSNMRSAVQWCFPLRSKWVFSNYAILKFVYDIDYGSRKAFSDKEIKIVEDVQLERALF